MIRLRTAIATVTLIACTTPAFAAQHPKNINKRQAVQQHRIAEGIESGTLTPRETATLERQEARINALEAKDRKSGGGLNPKERAELNRLLNSESHRIYKQKHDGQGK
jgi:Spy/CpxP family protein refolding chaperone